MAIQNQVPTPVFGINGSSMATSQISQVFILSNLTGISYGISWTNGSSPVGNILVEVSNDYALNGQGQVVNAGTWNVLPFLVSGSYVTSIPISGSSGNGFLDAGEIHAYAVRLVYQATSGTGTIFANFVGKFD